MAASTGVTTWSSACRFARRAAKCSVGLALLCGGCTVVPDDREDKTAGLPIFSPDPPLQSTRISIALSGGGIRSALASIGAIHALAIHAPHEFSRTAHLSTVSGGAYAGFWFMNDQQQRQTSDSKAAFGLDEARFRQNLCQFAVYANLVDFTDLAKALASPWTDSGLSSHTNWLLHQGRFSELYAKELREMYGHPWDQRKGNSDSLRLRDLEPSIRSGRLPEWIVGTTMVFPSPASWEEALLELTPLAAGTPASGYREWGEHRSPYAHHAVALSGAAVWPFLSSSVEIPKGKSGLSVVAAADGGLSENLGIAPLIRRGVTRILAFDFEHDPTFSFEGLRSLERRLSLRGFQTDFRLAVGGNRLPVRDAETASQNSVYTGVISRTSQRGAPINVTLVKLSLSRQLVSELLLATGCEWKTKHDGPHIECAHKDKYERKIPLSSGYGGCACAPLRTGELEKILAYRLLKYAAFRERTAINLRVQELWPDRVPSDFPHYTTYDQQHHSDQAFAFMALGYFLAKRSLPHLPPL
jgi:hypothetical protein